MKIIFWHEGTLGDLLISLPSMRLIRAHWGAEAILVARAPQGELLLRLGVVDRFFSSDSRIVQEVYEGGPGLLSDLEEGTLVILYTRNKGGFLANELRHKIGRFLYVISTADRDGRSVYEEQLIQAIEVIGGSHDKYRGAGFWDSFIESFIIGPRPQGRSDYLMVHPGSGGHGRCWPRENFFETLEKIVRETSLHPKIVVGPVEDARDPGLAAFFEGNGLTVMRGLSLIELHRQLFNAALFLGNDAGVSHLAALCGTPSVLIFGPTDPRVWAPPVPWVKVAYKKVKCSPCGALRNKCPKQICLEEVIPGEVAELAISTIST